MNFKASPATPFDAFYKQHFARAVAVAHALAGARAAEDIAQEAFWATFRKWDDLENPERWLWNIWEVVLSDDLPNLLESR